MFWHFSFLLKFLIPPFSSVLNCVTLSDTHPQTHGDNRDDAFLRVLIPLYLPHVIPLAQVCTTCRHTQTGQCFAVISQKCCYSFMLYSSLFVRGIYLFLFAQ